MLILSNLGVNVSINLLLSSINLIPRKNEKNVLINSVIIVDCPSF